jgi:hypothetical protein
MFLIYAVAMGAFAAMTPAFQGENKNHRLVYLVWYVVATLEAIAVVTISCSWRMLSFKKTHLMERMSLLTIIVIGEGAIGVTKTVARLMGKHGLDVEGCFLIMCIIIILVSLPEADVKRQVIWSLCADAIICRSLSGPFICTYYPCTYIPHVKHLLTRQSVTTSLTATTERFASKYGPCSIFHFNSPSLA